MLVRMGVRLEVVAMHTLGPGCELPLPMQVDGELLGEFDLIELGVVRDAAQLLV